MESLLQAAASGRLHRLGHASRYAAIGVKPFMYWDDDEDTLQGVAIRSPLYLVSAMLACNLCGKENPVAAIATLNIDRPKDAHPEEFPEGDGYLLTYVASYPPEIMREILARHQNYDLRFSQTMGKEYLMSICSCGGHYGDHYVHRQIMDTAFQTTDSLKVERLPLEGAWEIRCSIGSSDSLSAAL